ncbi:MAG: aminopeptidase P family protein [Verrucomicrobiales bacterium]|nr:aminopeptidase P family protein [Verrucomicrobiales bacterium]
MPKDSLLIVADSERNADMLYAVKAFVHDPFIWFTHKGRPLLVAPDPEIDRLRREARHCRVLSYSRYERQVERQQGTPAASLGDVLAVVLKDHRIRKVTVPESFPLGLAKVLRSQRIKVKLAPGPVFPDRAWKSVDEIKKISAAVVMAEVGLAEGLHALRRAKPSKGKRLFLNHAPLTAEKLRSIIDTAILQAGGFANHTIVACGRQSSDPHHRGHGPLVAGEPIVIDVFPRSQRTGYFGDVTRTVVRGRASEFVRGMFFAVVEAQACSMAAARHGVAAAEVHRGAETVFRRRGFRTCRSNGRMEGFFHGIGHGIGLEIHETPRLNSRSQESLRAGHVITLEPGLYYPEVGGVRLEDVVWIGKNGSRNLTKVEKQLEI